MSKIIKGNVIGDGGIIGDHMTLVVDDACRDTETGGQVYWQMEAQTEDISAPIVRCDRWAWALAADSAADCERVLGPQRATGA
jgi:hypothetical protein